MGREPESMFTDMSTYCNNFTKMSSSGIWPENRFRPSFNVAIDVIDPVALGIEPGILHSATNGKGGRLGVVNRWESLKLAGPRRVLCEWEFVETLQQFMTRDTFRARIYSSESLPTKNEAPNGSFKPVHLKSLRIRERSPGHSGLWTPVSLENTLKSLII